MKIRLRAMTDFQTIALNGVPAIHLVPQGTHSRLAAIHLAPQGTLSPRAPYRLLRWRLGHLQLNFIVM